MVRLVCVSVTLRLCRWHRPSSDAVIISGEWRPQQHSCRMPRTHTNWVIIVFSDSWAVRKGTTFVPTRLKCHLFKCMYFYCYPSIYSVFLVALSLQIFWSKLFILFSRACYVSHQFLLSELMTLVAYSNERKLRNSSLCDFHRFLLICS